MDFHSVFVVFLFARFRVSHESDRVQNTHTKEHENHSSILGRLTERLSCLGCKFAVAYGGEQNEVKWK